MTEQTTEPAAEQVTEQVTEQVPVVSNWVDGLSEDAKKFVGNKKYESPEDVVNSYMHLEKHLGVPKDRLIKLPENADDPAYSEVYSKLGRPDTFEGYDLKVDEGMEASSLDWVKDTFFEAGLTKKQAETIFAKYQENTAADMDAHEESFLKEIESEKEQLKETWGAAHDKKLNVAKSVVNQFQFDAATVGALQGALGYSKTMEFLADLGTKIGEAGYVGGDNVPMAPAEADAELARLKKDANFIAKYKAGDADAKARFASLNKMAINFSD